MRLSSRRCCKVGRSLISIRALSLARYRDMPLMLFTPWSRQQHANDHAHTIVRVQAQSTWAGCLRRGPVPVHGNAPPPGAHTLSTAQRMELPGAGAASQHQPAQRLVSCCAAMQTPVPTDLPAGPQVACIDLDLTDTPSPQVRCGSGRATSRA